MIRFTLGNAILLKSAALCLAAPFQIEIIDKETKWPVPLVQLKTTHSVGFVTDNKGVAAVDQPDLLGREVWFHMSSDGYEVPPDGFGQRGFRCAPVEDGKIVVEIRRKSIAKRLGRLTGAGMFAEAQKLGLGSPLPDSGVYGCDSVLLSEYRGGLFWLWGDTSVSKYPLGIFHSTAATTSRSPLEAFTPPISIDYKLFRGDDGGPRGVAHFDGKGPTWLGGMTTLRDKGGVERLVATYSKIEGHTEEHDVGLCTWNDEDQRFVVTKSLWKAGDGEKPKLPRGHPLKWTDPEGRMWVLFGDPFPRLRIPADYESWMDPGTWEEIKDSTARLRSADDGKQIEAHRGSVCWSPYRNRWITIFTQNLGKPSSFGELWYAESDSPLGPWGAAVKVMSHKNYSFYNPRIHPELLPENSKFIVFEGTYTAEFADKAAPTERYNYNQILYRVDLDDQNLKAAQR